MGIEKIILPLLIVFQSSANIRPEIRAEHWKIITYGSTFYNLTKGNKEYSAIFEGVQDGYLKIQVVNRIKGKKFSYPFDIPPYIKKFTIQDTTFEIGQVKDGRNPNNEEDLLAIRNVE
jgi:hypothetical protein